MQPIQTDSHVPGGIHLCQVGESSSCGACCGLYNVADASRDALQLLLLRRTSVFAGTERNVEALTAFAETEMRRIGAGPYPEFHHCPYVGLIGERKQRVGCLLHPLGDGNDGIDYRGMSYYGGMACRIYFCPSHYQLSPMIKSVVCAAAADWHAYGLLITETGLLQSFFAQVESRLGYTPASRQIVHNRQCMQAIQDFLALKFDWPFRAASRQHPCNYFFKDRQFHRPAVDYSACGAEGSRFDGIFEPLQSDFKNSEQLIAAESLLDNIFESVIEALK